MTRHRRSLVRPLLAALCLIVAIAAPARSEDEASHITKLENREFDGISFKGQSEFEIHDPELLPKQLVRAIEPGCEYRSGLKEQPVRFMAVDGWRFAIVPCSAIVGWDEIFDLREMRRPRLLQIPMANWDRGFVATSQPGAVTWNKEAKVFEITRRTDLCPSPTTRHIYRLMPAAWAPVLVRIDVRKDGCVDGEWATIWEAPAWPTQEDLR
ncbi:hypothetical protein S58_48000 [Bradyrhizobium oligotrophicum S58]|uniref:Uncharacterized protein n=1 Tax=Bradyrhizobium oligotrophicum S58 TaxID=1245469 RepID=M4ZAK5_9BRAD|nr:hypothetical protein [Bradyrhizobium oligotrophicum]BAM90779.1 hypothetical protein S58_48000 [Bradyrhizobium oligotrophicum S58]